MRYKIKTIFNIKKYRSERRKRKGKEGKGREKRKEGCEGRDSNRKKSKLSISYTPLYKNPLISP